MSKLILSLLFISSIGFSLGSGGSSNTIDRHVSNKLICNYYSTQIGSGQPTYKVFDPVTNEELEGKAFRGYSKAEYCSEQHIYCESECYYLVYECKYTDSNEKLFEVVDENKQAANDEAKNECRDEGVGACYWRGCQYNLIKK